MIHMAHESPKKPVSIFPDNNDGAELAKEITFLKKMLRNFEKKNLMKFSTG